MKIKEPDYQSAGFWGLLFSLTSLLVLGYYMGVFREGYAPTWSKNVPMLLFYSFSFVACMLASRGWFCWRREWKKAEQEREVLRLFILRFLDKGTAIQKAVDEELSTIAVELNDACLKEIAFQKGGLRAVRLLSSAEEERMSDEQVTERSVSMAQNLKSDIKTLLNLWNDERYDVAKKARNLLHNNFMILQKEWKAYLPKELRNKKP